MSQDESVSDNSKDVFERGVETVFRLLGRTEDRMSFNWNHERNMLTVATEGDTVRILRSQRNADAIGGMIRGLAGKHRQRHPFVVISLL